jgi:hypothetical protein
MPRRTRQKRAVTVQQFLESTKPYKHTPWVKGKAVDPNGFVEEPQSHGGDLKEHSLWTYYHTKYWLDTKNPLGEMVVPRIALASALVHDIGKGGDCIQSCIDGTCFFDVYSPNKYGGRGDRAHVDVGAEIIMGVQPYYRDCGTFPKRLDVRKMLAELDVADKQSEVAVVVAMHWEFGVLNIPSSETMQTRFENYVLKFHTKCSQFDVSPSLELLCTCIVVACADIASGTGKRLQGLYDVPMDVYLSKDPWLAYGMDKKAVGYRRGVIRTYIESI